MLDKSLRDQIIALIHREVVPAIGCTEPAAVALCVARACEKLGTQPEKITVRLSANVLKNAMGVGIPGTGMTGLPIAIALGVLIGKSAYGLEVLKDCTPEAVERGKKFINEDGGDRIEITLKDPAPDKLYIETEVSAGGKTAGAIIQGEHTHFIDEESPTQIACEFKEDASSSVGISSSDEPVPPAPELTLRTVWEFATETPLDEIRFMLEARDLNKAVSEESKKQHYGHEVGNILRRAETVKLLGDGLLVRLMSMTCLACDARMAGAMNAVMSNSGSGNQGIAATLPVVAYAEQTGASEEQLIRALTLSHLTAIYIKTSLGRLSALCGCVVAATGSSCGITYLMGGGYEAVSYAVKNMIANITGMICDGAKPSCSLKLTTGVSTALLSAMMAMENRYVTSVEGIIDDDVDQTIRNLTLIGRDGMNETDRLILQIMTSK